MRETIPSPDPGFGAYALPAPLEALRGYADHMPRGRAGRWGASLIRRICLKARPPPYDVVLFGSQKARLYPQDNRCEKRAFAGAHLWDGAERRYLDGMVAEGRGGFVFVDAGANVGLYTLSVRAACRAVRRPFTAIAIEPDPQTRARLVCNLASSGANEVAVAPVALAAGSGRVRLAAAAENRGEVRVDTAGSLAVDALPLLDVLLNAGIHRIDALKMDIEGMELPVLDAFLNAAPVAMLPRAMVLETGREGNAPLLARLAQSGYATVLTTRMNTVLGLARNPASAAATARLDS
ncbi:MAG: FkbM family methyltransferase [Pseudomonadota bacterium]